MNSPLTFQQDIKPLFTSEDQSAMEFMLDLWDYADVKENAAAILDEVESGRMPCGEPWPPERVARFRSWMESGMAE